MNELEDHLLRVMQVDDLEELWSLHRAAMGAYGFDRLIYAATEFRTAEGTGDVRDALILSTYPQEFMRDYIDGGLFQDAPMVRWAMQNVGSRSFREVNEDYATGRLDQAEMRVCEFNRRHRITGGYGISFPRVSERSGHGIGLASTRLTQEEVDALWDREGRRIELINHVTHLAIRALPYDAHGRRLTARQRQVLSLIADGKTVQEVALAVGRTTATIEKHLRLAREALDVETTAQAVLKAAVQDQFHTMPGSRGS